MRISAKLSVIIAAIFAIVCYSVAFQGFTALPELTDPTKRADAWGFALFWAFLGTIAVACGAIGIWIVRTHREEDF